MTLYATPELHAANPPESWTVERIPNGSRASFGLVIEAGQRPVETFTTRRDAEQAKANPESWHRKLYAKEARWYAGESVPGWQPYAEIQAEQAAKEHRQRRKYERAGLTAEQMTEWAALVTGVGGAPQGRLEDFLTELWDWFQEEELIGLNHLTLDEAGEVAYELGESFGLASDVQDELHRVKYLGIGADRSAVEVLEDLAQAERETAQYARIGVAA